MLSAHIDHLGVGTARSGDAIYNGANDDASGVAAVLELARAMAAAGPARRTLVVALYGSEETGGLGSTYFREHAPVPLDSVVANLQFEVIGHPDLFRLYERKEEKGDLAPLQATLDQVIRSPRARTDVRALAHELILCCADGLTISDALDRQEWSFLAPNSQCDLFNLSENR